MKAYQFRFGVVAFITLVFSNTVFAQLKLGDNPGTINPSAVLEMETTNKGLLLPRVTLTSTTTFAPLSAHIAGMTVYNTATAGDVTPGYYYNDGTKWVKLSGSAWSLTGNTATNWQNNYLGTSDLQSLRFRTNNAQRMMIDSTFGNVGIGRDFYPNAKLNILYDEAQTNVQAQPNGIYNEMWVRQTANGLKYAWGINSNVKPNISAGVTNTGFYEGIRSDVIRTLATDAGTLAASTGMSINYGHATGLAATATTTNASGLQIFSYGEAGTITNMRDLYIRTSNPGGTITNRWAIFQEDVNAKNYFAGNLGINTTTPQYKLDIDANTGASGNPLRLLGLNAGATTDSVLTSNAGVVRRLGMNQLNANNWQLGGNAVSSVQNIGTTSNFDLPFLTNNTERMRITTAGNVGIGTTAPNNLLTIDGMASNYTSGTLAYVNASTNSSTSNQLGLAAKLSVNPAAVAGALSMAGIFGTADAAGSNLGNITLKAVHGEIYYTGTGALNLAAGITGNLYNTSTGTIGRGAGVHVLSNVNSGGGTITNNYGVLVENQTAGANDYGVYIEGAETRSLHVNTGTSYFGGNVGVGTVTPTSTLQVSGSIAVAFAHVTANTTLNGSNHIVLADATLSPITLTLPTASTCTGRTYVIGKSDETANVVTVSPALSLTKTTTISTLNFAKKYKIVSDGTNWWIYSE
ncbi:MAG: hypothetical protein RL757_2151 [Bacteroidota bacterium]